MEHTSSISFSATKSKGYRHRSRPGTTKARKAPKKDGKDVSVRHRPRPSTTTANPESESIIIPFPVPPILSTRWLIKMAPIVLAQHLVYARGMWPVSVPQLLLLLQQDKTSQESKRNSALASYHRTGQQTKDTTNNKRQRLNNASRINPSLRRKQQRAMDQINRLSDEWAGSMDGKHNGCNQNQRYHDYQLPKFVLISLGSSYVRGRELFLFDFQSLINLDEQDDDGISRLTQEQEQKYNTMLAQKLVSTLMNHKSHDERPSVINSLPNSASPSFRLWFTAGFENHSTVHSSDHADEEHHINEPLTGTLTSEHVMLARETDRVDASTFSNTSWIPRTKFPRSNQKPPMRSSSQTQSMITIRFVRSRKQNQTSQNASMNSNKDPRGSDVSTIPDLLDPSSEQLVWKSLATHVKGFRL